MSNQRMIKGDDELLQIIKECRDELREMNPELDGMRMSNCYVLKRVCRGWLRV